LSKGRAEELRQLPLQDCDALLHEAGAPPIHTPLSVLQALPDHVKERLYVVHTSALPVDCGLRVAPTGIAGTIRLDRQRLVASSSAVTLKSPGLGEIDPASLDDGGNRNLSLVGDYFEPDLKALKKSSLVSGVPPLVHLRPTSISDAWFMLNLLSNVPFFSTLSYASTMEVLEIAKVAVFCDGKVVIPANRRIEALCIVWEGACVEREGDGDGRLRKDDDPGFSEDKFDEDDDSPTIWYAGDWIGPVALQPDIKRSALKASNKPLQDIIAVASEGVKVIMLQMKDLEAILQRGSKIYRKYLQLQLKHAAEEAAAMTTMQSEDLAGRYPMRSGLGHFAFDHLLGVLECNSVLGNLSATQKRSLESIAEGPRVFEEGSTLWNTGDRCNYNFLLATGNVSFNREQLPKPQGQGSGGPPGRPRQPSIGAIVEVGGGRSIEADRLLSTVPHGSEYARLESLLIARAQTFGTEDGMRGEHYLSGPRDRFANKVLARLYASRRFTGRMVFSRGCFLGDTTRMVHMDLLADARDIGDNCHS